MLITKNYLHYLKHKKYLSKSIQTFPDSALFVKICFPILKISFHSRSFSFALWEIEIEQILLIQLIFDISHCVKSVSIRSFSGPYFPPFRVNAEKYGLSPHIQSKCGIIRTRKTPNTFTFHAVTTVKNQSDEQNLLYLYL